MGGPDIQPGDGGGHVWNNQVARHRVLEELKEQNIVNPSFRDLRKIAKQTLGDDIHAWNNEQKRVSSYEIKYRITDQGLVMDGGDYDGQSFRETFIDRPRRLGLTLGYTPDEHELARLDIFEKSILSGTKQFVTATSTNRQFRYVEQWRTHENGKVTVKGFDIANVAGRGLKEQEMGGVIQKALGLSPSQALDKQGILFEVNEKQAHTFLHRAIKEVQTTHQSQPVSKIDISTSSHLRSRQIQHPLHLEYGYASLKTINQKEYAKQYSSSPVEIIGRNIAKETIISLKGIRNFLKEIKKQHIEVSGVENKAQKNFLLGKEMAPPKKSLREKVRFFKRDTVRVLQRVPEKLNEKVHVFSKKTREVWKHTKQEIVKTIKGTVKEKLFQPFTKVKELIHMPLVFLLQKSFYEKKQRLIGKNSSRESTMRRAANRIIIFKDNVSHTVSRIQNEVKEWRNGFIPFIDSVWQKKSTKKKEQKPIFLVFKRPVQVIKDTLITPVRVVRKRLSFFKEKTTILVQKFTKRFKERLYGMKKVRYEVPKALIMSLFNVLHVFETLVSPIKKQTISRHAETKSKQDRQRVEKYWWQFLWFVFFHNRFFQTEAPSSLVRIQGNKQQSNKKKGGVIFQFLQSQTQGFVRL